MYPFGRPFSSHGNVTSGGGGVTPRRLLFIDGFSKSDHSRCAVRNAQRWQFLAARDICAGVVVLLEFVYPFGRPFPGREM